MKSSAASCSVTRQPSASAADASPAVLAALRRRFRAELLTLSTFQHPRIVRLLHACEDTGDAAHPLALAFELLAGGSLADWLRGADGRAGARGALSPLQRIDAALGVAHGLKYLHGLREASEGAGGAPVVHRDVKSANVGFSLLGGGGAGDELYAKLIDCVSS
jgi:serine/threonine protein kinase